MIKRYFLYDPEGDGFQAFATAEARDEAAAKALPLYIVDGEWDETVFEVVAGEITHITEKTNVVRRPDDLNDDSEDASGEYWQPYTSEKFNVKMQPAPACEASARERDDLHALCNRQADILSRVAVALRGPEPPQTRWSHHDLPERAAKAVRERDEWEAKYHTVHQHNTMLQEHDYELSVKAEELADLRARIEALANEMETDDRAGKLAHWIGAIRAVLAEGAEAATGGEES